MMKMRHVLIQIVSHFPCETQPTRPGGGKTYTMEGPSCETVPGGTSRGVIPRAVDLVFQEAVGRN